MDYFSIASYMASLPYTIFLALFVVGNYVGGVMQKKHSVKMIMLIGYLLMAARPVFHIPSAEQCTRRHVVHLWHPPWNRRRHGIQCHYCNDAEMVSRQEGACDRHHPCCSRHFGDDPFSAQQHMAHKLWLYGNVPDTRSHLCCRRSVRHADHQGTPCGIYGRLQAVGRGRRFQKHLHDCTRLLPVQRILSPKPCLFLRDPGVCASQCDLRQLRHIQRSGQDTARDGCFRRVAHAGRRPLPDFHRQ